MIDSLRNVLVHDEDAFLDDLPDAALEIAGRKLFEGPAGSATISFCSGYDTCPWQKDALSGGHRYPRRKY
jgi:hypothetical protein